MEVDFKENDLNEFVDSLNDDPGIGPVPDPEPEAGPGPDENEAMRQLNKTLTTIIKSADSVAKENGYKGLGDIPPADYAELAGICAKRNFSSVIVEKSPEVAFGSITLLVIIQNLSGKRAETLTENKQAKDAD